MSDSDIIQAINVPPQMFGLFMAVAKSCSWLAQGTEWTGKRSYDIILAMSDFFNDPATGNATESAPQLAERFGTSTERAQYLMDFMQQNIGMSFPDLIEMMKPVFPLAGHPENNSDLFTGIFVMFTLLVGLFVGLRLYSRFTINGFLRAYDWVLIVATLITIGFGGMNAYCLSGPTHYRGTWDQSWKDYHVFSWSEVATEVLYPVGIFLIKASLLLFYWGLTAWWPLRLGAAAMFVISLGNGLAMIFTAIFRCSPVLSYEGYDFFTTTCNIDLHIKGEEICGSINVATDIIIWLMPLPMVWKIIQGNRERFLSALTFGIGALACIACGLRFRNVQEYRTAALVPRDQSKWLLWCLVEMNLAIICSCVPAIRALVIKKAPALIGSTGDRSLGTGIRYDDKDDKEKGTSVVNFDSASDK
ncbi:hypothetical protein TWF569_001163 [Orbilia oligospora]|nr:hypothetical protein TWF569_001163 [Orbilia oligospora]